MFNGFSKEGLDFFKELEANNSKPWFEAHKSRYEKYILETNRAFVVEMGEHLECLVPTIHALPKVNQSLFKIYKDTRFSKDKSALKTHTAILFWQGKGSRMQSSAFYLHYDAHEVLAAAGLHHFDTAMLACYRDYIKDEDHRQSLATILKQLQAKGYSLPIARYKRLPNGFNKEMPHSELALFDGMYASKAFKPHANFFSSKIVDDLFTIYEEMLQLQQWVYEMTLTQKDEA